jgi:hypothetical protein
MMNSMLICIFERSGILIDTAGKPATQESSLDVFCHVIKDVFCCRTGLRNLEGPFYESHYLYESKNTDTKFKHFRSRMSVEMILSTKYYK